MITQKQEKFKQKQYTEAMRYFNNAKELLKKTERDGRYFKDSKYVSSASSVVYKGVLVALDCWLSLKGVEVPRSVAGKKNRKSIEFYRNNIARLDKKLLKDFNSVYETLHLFGYYDGTLIVGIVDLGFKISKEIINLIKPTQEAV